MPVVLELLSLEFAHPEGNLKDKDLTMPTENGTLVGGAAETTSAEMIWPEVDAWDTPASNCLCGVLRLKDKSGLLETKQEACCFGGLVKMLRRRGLVQQQ